MSPTLYIRQKDQDKRPTRLAPTEVSTIYKQLMYKYKGPDQPLAEWRLGFRAVWIASHDGALLLAKGYTAVERRHARLARRFEDEARTTLSLRLRRKRRRRQKDASEADKEVSPFVTFKRGRAAGQVVKQQAPKTRDSKQKREEGSNRSRSGDSRNIESNSNSTGNSLE